MVCSTTVRSYILSSYLSLYLLFLINNLSGDTTSPTPSHFLSLSLSFSVIINNPLQYTGVRLEIKDYVILPRGEKREIPPRHIICDVTLVHDRHGKSHWHPSGNLTNPREVPRRKLIRLLWQFSDQITNLPIGIHWKKNRSRTPTTGSDSSSCI